ncbi:MAG TPA: MBL fold metallo-hydrolase [Bryobacteraceae bacterium]|nr:MBL fold metallo-hydrolase [Bryobacteraceae bacterium]
MDNLLSRTRHQAVFVFFAAAVVCWAQPQINPDNVKLTMAHVQGSVYVLMGDGGNITVQVGKDGVAMVDTGFAPLAVKAMAEIRKLNTGPVVWIVNTHVHTDHTGGNAEIMKLGMTRESVGPPRLVAQSNVLNRMSGPQPNGAPPIPEAAWPNDEYFLPTKDFFFNSEAVIVYHVPNAHTDGDSLVFFRRSDVLSTGDIFTPEHYPIIDLARGGSVEGEIKGLNQIIDITVPAKYQEGGTMVIPGHGRLCDEADVVEYRNMVTIIRDRLVDMIHRGMTLEQVKAAKPTLDYDTQYGATSGIWTTDMFVEAAYKSLSTKTVSEK